MAIYSAYLPPNASGEAALKGFELVPEGKALLALIFPVIWLAVKRLWLPLLVYILVSAIIVLIASIEPGLPLMYLAALPGFYLLLEGNELVRQKMERTGWRFAGIVDADNRKDAEIKFIASNPKLFDATKAPSSTGSPGNVSAVRPAHLHSIPAGLFPE